MNANFPVPIELCLPSSSWSAADPRRYRMEDVLMMAVRTVPPSEYVPSISVRGGPRLDPVSLDAIADETIDGIRAYGAAADLVKRIPVGTQNAPALVQRIEIDASIEGARLDLCEVQAVRSLSDVRVPAKRIVVIASMVCTYRQMPVVGPEFRRFMEDFEILPGLEQVVALATAERDATAGQLRPGR